MTYYHRHCGTALFTYPHRMAAGEMTHRELAVVLPGGGGDHMVALRCMTCEAPGPGPTPRFNYESLEARE